MTTPWLISYVLLWMLVLCVGFLLLGTLNSLGRLQWRLAHFEATRPKRTDREGLEPGTLAPNFSLPSGDGTEISLSDFAGQRVLLVFTQTGCPPCHEILPELNRQQKKGSYQVLVVNYGEFEEAKEYEVEFHTRFPVLCQDNWSISKLYKTYATPYAFVIDEGGVIAAQGIASNRQYLQYALSEADKRPRQSGDFYDRVPSVGHAVSTRNSTKETIYV